MSNLEGPWFPIVFSDKCDGCVKTGEPRCVEFCPNGVYKFQNGKAVVAHPENCGIPNCSACAPLCHSRAISFPQRDTMQVPTARLGNDMLRKTICPKCGKHYWTNRKTDLCIDCENQH